MSSPPPYAEGPRNPAHLNAPQPTPEAPEKKSRCIALSVGGTLLLGLFIAMLVLAAAIWPVPLQGDARIVIPRGASVADAADRLQQATIVPNKFMFRLVARFLAKGGFKAGEYTISTDHSIVDIVAMMRDGQSVVRKLTVAEGLTSVEIVNILRCDATFSGTIDEIPPEGSLLPETYRYNFGDTRQSMIERMQKALKDKLGALWAMRDVSIPLSSPQEAVILASIVEKETGKKAEERPRVAGVFYNRLRQGMRLQSDPTVIYALTGGRKLLGRELDRNDLTFVSPYNTYVNTGLPPGPISNPGAASLQASLQPEHNDFIYFVADGTGGHAFAKDLATHNKNVTRWLSICNP